MAMVMAAMTHGRLDRLKGQAGNAASDVQTGLLAEGQRLQRDRVPAADQNIGAEADADGDGARHAAVISGERAMRGADRRSEHRPGDLAARGRADVDAKLGDRADIGVDEAALGIEGAVQRALRRDDHAHAAGDLTMQCADLDLVGGSRMRRESESRHGRGEHDGTQGHRKFLPFATATAPPGRGKSGRLSWRTEENRRRPALSPWTAPLQYQRKGEG